jgi:glycogen synthase
MRILVITNFYPPYAIGGMEHRCQETINLLRKRGHEVIVLTSTYGVSPQGVVDGMEYRLLALESDLMHYQPLRFFLNWWQDEKHNLRTFEYVLNKFKPDLVFIWGMWNLSHQLPYYAEKVWKGPVVYSLANDWPAQPSIHESYWRLPARHRVMKPLKYHVGNLALNYFNKSRKNIDLQFNHVICASRALRDQLLKAGVPLQDAPVIYPGINLEQFSKNGLQRKETSALRLSLLYAGSLVEHKGVHTAIEAMGHLSKEELDLNLKFTIVGSGHKSYENHIHTLVDKYRLHNKISFINQIPRDEMPDLMRISDVLLFPSIWEEPFSRVVLEAMASGLVVIGTETGGTKEILKHGETGLSFPPGDAGALARCVKQLIEKPELKAKLSKNGRMLVERQFDIHRMVDEIEAYLEDVIKPSSAIPGSVKRNQESLRVA